MVDTRKNVEKSVTGILWVYMIQEIIKLEHAVFRKTESSL